MPLPINSTKPPTNEPTLYPTDESTTYYRDPTVNQQLPIMNNAIFIVAVIACILLCLLLIVCIAIYFKMDNKNKQKPHHIVVTPSTIDTPSPKSVYQYKKDDTDPDPNQASMTSSDPKLSKKASVTSTFGTLPKLLTITPPGLAEQDSLNIEGANHLKPIPMVHPVPSSSFNNDAMLNEEEHDYLYKKNNSQHGDDMYYNKIIEDMDDEKCIELHKKGTTSSEQLYDSPMRLKIHRNNTEKTQGEESQKEHVSVSTPL